MLLIRNKFIDVVDVRGLQHDEDFVLALPALHHFVFVALVRITELQSRVSIVLILDGLGAGDLSTAVVASKLVFLPRVLLIHTVHLERRVVSQRAV